MKTLIEQPKNEDTRRQKINETAVGVYCTVVSDQASSNNLYDASTGSFNVNLIIANATEILESCVEEYTTTCTLMTFDAFVMEKSESGLPELKGKAKKIYEVCQKISNLESCMTDITTCDSDLVVDFVSSFISFGKKCGADDPEGMLDGDTTELEALNSSVKETTARLLESSFKRVLEGTEPSAECTSSFSANGIDAIAIGKGSGIDFEEYKGSMILAAGTVAMLAGLFK